MNSPLGRTGAVLQMLIAGRPKFVTLRGSKFRYRSARVVSVSLNATLSEDSAVRGAKASRPQRPYPAGTRLRMLSSVQSLPEGRSRDRSTGQDEAPSQNLCGSPRLTMKINRQCRTLDRRRRPSTSDTQATAAPRHPIPHRRPAKTENTERAPSRDDRQFRAR
jgi:hypothetical protein